jgi:hypothetical protein
MRGGIKAEVKQCTVNVRGWLGAYQDVNVQPQWMFHANQLQDNNIHPFVTTAKISL